MDRRVERQRFIGDPAEHFVQVEGEDYMQPVEALDKWERARLSGYLQMHDEVGRHITPRPIGSIGRAYAEVLGDAALAFGRHELNSWVRNMLQDLSRLSGHPESLVVGVIVDWHHIVNGGNTTRAEWRRIWTGT